MGATPWSKHRRDTHPLQFLEIGGGNFDFVGWDKEVRLGSNRNDSGYKDGYTLRLGDET